MDLTDFLKHTNTNSRRVRKHTQFYKIKFCPFYRRGNCDRGAQCCFAHSPDELCAGVSLRKTKLCTLWREGRCSMGEGCAFAHGEAELRSTPEYFKTSLCKFWLDGHCHLGTACRHAHGEAELRQKGDFLQVANPPGLPTCCTPQDSQATNHWTTSVQGAGLEFLDQAKSVPYVELYDGVRSRHVKVMMNGCNNRVDSTSISARSSSATTRASSSISGSSSDSSFLTLTDILGANRRPRTVDPFVRHWKANGSTPGLGLPEDHLLRPETVDQTSVSQPLCLGNHLAHGSSINPLPFGYQAEPKGSIPVGQCWSCSSLTAVDGGDTATVGGAEPKHCSSSSKECAVSDDVGESLAAVILGLLQEDDW